MDDEYCIVEHRRQRNTHVGVIVRDTDNQFCEGYSAVSGVVSGRGRGRRGQLIFDPSAELSLSSVTFNPVHFTRDNTITKCILNDNKQARLQEKRPNVWLQIYRSTS